MVERFESFWSEQRPEGQVLSGFAREFEVSRVPILPVWHLARTVRWNDQIVQVMSCLQLSHLDRLAVDLEVYFRRRQTRYPSMPKLLVLPFVREDRGRSIARDLKQHISLVQAQLDVFLIFTQWPMKRPVIERARRCLLIEGPGRSSWARSDTKPAGSMRAISYCKRASSC